MVRYPGHFVRTRRQAAWLCVAMLGVLAPLAVWRGLALPANLRIALIALTLAPFVSAYQAWRFLEEQERLHAEPTAGMIFVFRFLANAPLTYAGLLFVVLVAFS